jgi:hypothetical protein
MKKQVYYTYMGTNGTITSPVHLEDMYYIRKIMLFADEGYSLTRNYKNYFQSMLVPEDEVDQWVEIKMPSGQK